MAFRATNYWKLIANELRGRSSLTASTSAKLSTYADGHQLAHSSSGGIRSKLPKGDVLPICVALGMIGLSASFAVYTAHHQLSHAPNVSVKKSRRGTVPEVADPEYSTNNGERFVKQSFFRKVAHVQDFDRQETMSNPIGGDVFARPMQAESSKDKGVQPRPN